METRLNEQRATHQPNWIGKGLGMMCWYAGGADSVLTRAIVVRQLPEVALGRGHRWVDQQVSPKASGKTALKKISASPKADADRPATRGVDGKQTS